MHMDLERRRGGGRPYRRRSDHAELEVATGRGPRDCRQRLPELHSASRREGAGANGQDVDVAPPRVERTHRQRPMQIYADELSPEVLTQGRDDAIEVHLHPWIAAL